MEPRNRTGLGLLRNRLRRFLDFWSWRLTGTLKTHYTTFEDHRNSNIGDIAIGTSVLEQLESFLEWPTEDVIQVGWGDLTQELVDTINRDCVPFLIGGSGYLHCGSVGRLSPLVVKDIELLERLTVPKICYAPGMNRILSDEILAGIDCATDESKALLARFVDTMDLVAVRDEPTADLLRSVGDKPIHVVGDPVLHIGAETSRSSKRHRDLTEPLRIGVNFSLHGPSSQDYLFANINLYIDYLKALSTAYDCQLVYFAHSDGERFIHRMLTSKGVEIEFRSGTAEVLLKDYAELDLHICQMMHSSILAMSVGVPTLNFGYDMKNFGLYDLLGFPELCLRINALDLPMMMAATSDLIARRDEVSSALESRIRELRSELEVFAQEVCDLVGLDCVAR